MRIAVCDDNAVDLERYSELIKRFADENHILLELEQFKSGEQALFHLEERQNPLDILFLDINMPGISGIDTAEKLRSSAYGYTGEIIFLTVSRQYMLSAFDVHAFHYIVKDEMPEQRIRDIFLQAVARAEKRRQESFLFNGISEYRSIEIKSIFYFDVMKKIITVHYGERATFEFYCSIAKLETMVLPKGFLRVHRSYIANITQIESFNFNGVKLKNGETIPCGRKYYPEIKKVLGGETI